MTISPKRRWNCSLGLRMIAMAFSAVLALDGRHPPAHAQDQPMQQQWMISNEDAVQDSSIASINKHLEHTDSQVDRAETRLQATESQLSEMQGEERIAFAVLTLLTGGSIAFQVKLRSEK